MKRITELFDDLKNLESPRDSDVAARDVLAEWLQNIDKKGYKIVDHVHDEVIIELKDDTKRESIMSQNQKTTGWKMCAVRPSVENFSLAMEEKLKQKDAQKGEEGWLEPDCTTRFLKDEMTKEMRELYSAFDDCSPAELMAECVDVANFAMMIYDRLLRVKVKKV